MNLRIALSALAAVAVAASAPAIASAQTPAPKGGVVASTPVPNPPEKAKTTKAHAVKHQVKKSSHRRHKVAVTRASSMAPAKTGGASVKK